MIVEGIIQVISSTIVWIISLLDFLPDMPPVIVSLGDQVLDFAEVGFSFVYSILGKPLSMAIFTLISTVVSFVIGRRLLLWFYRLIRG